MKKREICAREKRLDFETQLCYFIYSLLSVRSLSGTVLGTGNIEMNKTVCSEGPYSIMRRQMNTQLITQK